MNDVVVVDAVVIGGVAVVAAVVVDTQLAIPAYYCLADIVVGIQRKDRQLVMPKLTFAYSIGVVDMPMIVGMLPLMGQLEFVHSA